MIDEVPEVQLFNLEDDIGETANVVDKHPEIVKRLMASIESVREELGDCDRIGTGARFFDSEPKRPGIQKYKLWVTQQKEQ